MLKQTIALSGPSWVKSKYSFISYVHLLITSTVITVNFSFKTIIDNKAGNISDSIKNLPLL